MYNVWVYEYVLGMGSNDAANAIELIKQIYTFAFDAYFDWLNLG